MKSAGIITRRQPGPTLARYAANSSLPGSVFFIRIPSAVSIRRRGGGRRVRAVPYPAVLEHAGRFNFIVR
jgi:hypothetical protein